MVFGGTEKVFSPLPAQRVRHRESLQYDDTGFDATFDDSASYDNIHFYKNFDYGLNGGQLTGTWSSDGRAVDPMADPAVIGATQPSAFLSSFDGANPNGNWTLFAADLSGGGQSSIVNWGLSIETVPEPSTRALFGISLAVFLAAGKRAGLVHTAIYKQTAKHRKK
ncbi:MAG TPA: hypothetical protein VGI63_07010 [Verrucomicrobiae bacterium]|jgi:hypothetical protein